MQLKTQKWRRVGVHEVYAAFLKAEWDRIPLRKNWPRTLVTHPNLQDHRENYVRSMLLRGHRGPLLGEVPSDTIWHQVDSLTERHLPELRVIGRCGWDSPADKNELPQVAARKPLPLRQEPRQWEPIILWGHQKSGPFTILEGNHRLTAYASTSGAPPFSLPVFVGLSPSLCAFHLADTVVIFESPPSPPPAPIDV